MIIKFEKYKNINESVSDNLASQFSDEFINAFYKKHMHREVEEIVELWPNKIWEFIDDDRYMEVLKEEEKYNLNVEYFGEDVYKKYLQDDDNMDDDKKKIVIDLYNENEGENEDEYGEYMLDDLSENQLRKIIEDDGYDFMEFAVEDKYEDKDAEDVARELYSMDDGGELYKAFGYYVDDEALEKDYDDNVNKVEEIQDQIANYLELQEKLLKIDKVNALPLAELVKTHNKYNYSDNIGNTFKFQKAYVKYYVREKISLVKGEDGYKEERFELRQGALEYIDKHFDIDRRFNEMYPEEMDNIILKQNVEKYNI